MSILEMFKNRNHNRRNALIIPTELKKKMEEVARSRGITLRQLIQRIIKIGLIAYSMESKPGSSIFIREENGVEVPISLD